jgi:hypothetical protein
VADPVQENLLREIQEDLRRERLEKLWKRYGAYFIGAVVAVVLAVAAYQAWQGWELGRREEASGAFLAAEERSATDPGAAANAFAGITDEGSGGFSMLAAFRKAALLTRQGRADEAAAAYESLAAELEDPLYRDLARLRWVSARLRADAAAGDEGRLNEALDTLTRDTNPWRYSAREITASLALQNGDVAKARALFEELRADVETPQGIRGRAAEMLVRIDGQ